MHVYECDPSQWPERLKGTALLQAVPHLARSGARVVVVEDDAGTLIGVWALLSVLHAEGVWINPAHQRKGAVARKLWTMMTRFVRESGASGVVTGADSEDIARLLERHGAQKLAMTSYVLPMGARECL